MSNDRPKLTLERWAALDQAASPGPWDQEALFWLLRFARKNSGPWDEYGDFPGEDDADLICASRQAPTRLLAALRGLADEWKQSAEQNPQPCGGDNCRGCTLAKCYAQLRALIEQTDLSEDAR